MWQEQGEVQTRKEEKTMQQDMIVILDLGSEQNTLIAREIRALGVYTEIHPHDITKEQLAALRGPQGPAGEKGAQGPAGAAGESGKSAYQYAQEGGYTGTEEEFGALLGLTGTIAAKLDEINGEVV